jgi:Na+/H+-dicarboxylate symporter/ABC-type amino acid transport substrate-binding protein
MNRFFKSLPLQMLFATFLGIATGVIFGERCQVFARFGEAYIMLMKMTILPYLICAIIGGIGRFESTQAREILKKGILFIALTWFINIVMIYFTVFSFPKPKGGQIGSFITSGPPALDFAELLIPENIFYALANNIVPAAVIFSLLVGIALINLKEKRTFMDFLEIFGSALTRITQWIARITPLGTFLIIATQVGMIDLATVKQVGTYLILYIFTLLFITLWIFPRLTNLFTSIPTLRWLKDLFPILLLAYTANTVIVCLPYIIQLLEKKTQFSEKAQDQNEGIVSIVFTLPFSSFFITVFIFFSALLYNVPIPGLAQVQLFLTTFLTGLGAIGPGSWLNSLTFLLDVLGLPLDALELFILTMPFTSGFQSVLSAMQITSVSLFITLACQKRLIVSWRNAAKSLLITALPVLLIFGGIWTLKPLPLIETEGRTICDLDVRNDVPVTIYTTPQKSASGDPFDRILESKVLRVGYNPHAIPFCFYNSRGNLVGYDIAFAYELAHDLDCRLELVPMEYPTAVDAVNHNAFDIGMSAISISEKRLEHGSFTLPYLQAKLVLVAPDKKRKEFSKLAPILKKPTLKIAVLKDTCYVLMAKKLFPRHELILIENPDEFAEGSIADFLFWSEQDAISWVIRNPRFSVIFPDPALGIDSLGYLVRQDAIRLLNFLDQWLELKKNEGFTQKQYNQWILGK